MKLTKEYFNELFEYKDGKIYWKITKGRGNVGDEVGCMNSHGYRRIKLNQKEYATHRIIFLMHHGYLPEIVDHKDNNPLNNHIENLREATGQQNNFNSRRQKNNTTGYKGVYYNKNIKKFCARSKNMGTRTYLGDFNTAEEAYEAYCAYGRIHHGEFFNDGNK